MLSEKYIAGFLDSDGSIGINWRPLDRSDTNPTQRRGYVTLSFSQAAAQNEVLYLIKHEIGGTIRAASRDGKYTELRLNGKHAEQILYRIKKHLVINREYCERVLAITSQAVDAKTTKARLKEDRKRRSTPLPNYPSRKWMAGYLDGDGSITARLSRDKAAQPVLSVACSSFDREGIELLQKAFGGSISDRERVSVWTVVLGASKASKVLGHCAQHMLVKKDQADFIMGCAKMGHYRDGIRIRMALKQLKAHPHRLSEPKANVGRLLANIRDIKSPRVKAREAFEANQGCVDCGKDEHYCHAVCRSCYSKRRNAA